MLGESFGAGVGCAFTLMFVNSADIKDNEKTKNEIFRLCYVVAIIFTVIYSIALMFLKEKPEIPPTQFYF